MRHFASQTDHSEGVHTVTKNDAPGYRSIIQKKGIRKILHIGIISSEKRRKRGDEDYRQVYNSKGF